MNLNISKEWSEKHSDEGEIGACNPNYRYGITLGNARLQLIERNKDKKQRLILLCGIPGAGKSLYANWIAEKINGFVLCPDTLRKEVTGSESDMSCDGFIWGQLIEERLKFYAIVYRKNIIFDATMINRRSRKTIIDLGEKYGLVLECHYYEPDMQFAKFNNKCRSRQVPEEVIEKFAARFEVPTHEEGFSYIQKLN